MLCARMGRDVGVALVMIMLAAVECMFPPGKPFLQRCWSPDKETFTCWWEPGADGGLPTTYRLYYERDQMEGMHECPDYHSAGRNSCFFNKNHTSIWVDYFLTVVASNALGNATSDTLKVDVMDVVKPNVPGNVTLHLEGREESPILHIRWEHHLNTRKKAGWITLEYQLRIKQEKSNKWNDYMSGKQTHFSLYSVTPGTLYMVQVRCRLDHGFWSEWTNTTYIKVPKFEPKQSHLWILVSALTVIPIITTMCILVMKRKYVKQWLLPPVPGPKIRGVDVQLLKSGRSEDITSALIITQSFPPTANWKNQMEDFLMVYDDNDGLQKSKKKGLIIPNGFHLESEKQYGELTVSQNNLKNRGKEKEEMDNFVKSNKCFSGESLSNCKIPTDAKQRPSMTDVKADTTDQTPLNQGNTAQSTAKPTANSGYVDVQRHEEKPQVDLEQVDYSRVTDWNTDNIVIVKKDGFCLSNSDYVDVERQGELMPDDYCRVKEVNSDNMVFLQKETDSSCRKAVNQNTNCANQKPQSPHVTGKVGLCTEFFDNGYVDNVPSTHSM